MSYQTSRTLEIKWSVEDPESCVKYCEWAVGKNVTYGGVKFETMYLQSVRINYFLAASKSFSHVVPLRSTVGMKRNSDGVKSIAF